MAKAILLLSLALLVWIRVLPLVECADEKAADEKKTIVTSSQEAVVSADVQIALDIPREQKRLRKEVKALQKSTHKQIAKLEKRVDTLNFEIHEVEAQISIARMRENDLEKIQRRTKQLLSSIGMEVEPTELRRENIRKTIQNITAAIEGKIGKIKADQGQLGAALDAQYAESERKMRAFYAKKIEETKRELNQKIDLFEAEGGHIEELGTFRTRGEDAKTKLNNEIVDLKFDLKRYKQKTAKINWNAEECRSEAAQIESATARFREQREKLEDTRPLDKHLSTVGELDAKTIWMDMDKKYTMPTPQQIQKMEEMRDELKAKKAELVPLELRKRLETVLLALIDCLGDPFDAMCKNRRAHVEELSQRVALDLKKRSDDVQKNGARKSSLLEKFGKLFEHEDVEKKLQICVKETISAYESAAKEKRKQMKAEASNYGV